MQSADDAEHYKTKAEECRKWAASALTPGEKEDWSRLAAEWEAMASQADLSGHLPWKVRSG
jgi:hypothetical protein